MSHEPATLLSIHDARVWFPIQRGVFSRTVGHVRAVDGVSLDIKPGRTLGLVGESGCGKSTLARAIVGLEPLHAGSICFQGTDMSRMDADQWKTARRDLQVVFQDPFASLNPRMTVFDIITEALVVHKLIAGREREAVARELLSDVGLGHEALHRYPHEFSGGQRQRICVARALAMKPKLIICDEAVSALDVSVQAQIINLLMELREKYGLAYLFIAHDLSVVRHIAHEVAVMYLGQIVEHGEADAVIHHPVHPYSRALVSAIPRAGKDRKQRIVLAGEVPSPANPPPGCRFNTRCPHAVDACSTTLPPLESHAGTERRVACIRKDSIAGSMGT